MAPAAIALPPRMTGNFVFAIDTSDMLHKFCFLPDCDVGQQNQPLLPTPVSALSVATAGKLVYVTHAQSAVVTTYSVDATNGADLHRKFSCWFGCDLGAHLPRHVSVLGQFG
jgi:hypothetical protein